MFNVVATFYDGHTESQGKYRFREFAEARVAGLKKHYPHSIKDCEIIPTGKDKK